MNRSAIDGALRQRDETAVRSTSSAVPLPRGADPYRVTPEQVDRARLAVARGAADTDDCRQLLDMLGLIDGPDGLPPVRR